MKIFSTHNPIQRSPIDWTGFGTDGQSIDGSTPEGVTSMLNTNLSGGGGNTSGSASAGGDLAGEGNNKGGEGDVYRSDATGMQGAAEDMGAGLVQMVTGIVQQAGAAKKKREAEKLFPSLIDPLEAKAYSQYKKLERSTQTGVAFQNDLNKVLSAEQATNRGIAAKSGGAGGAAIAGMSKTNRMFGQAMNDLIDKTAEQRMYYDQMANAKQERITDTKRDLELLKYGQKMAEATQQKQEGKANTMGGATRAMSGVNSAFANMYGMGSEGGGGGGGGGDMMSMIGGGGGAAGGAAMSDVRLKDDINLISNSPSGIPIYTFRYTSDNTEQVWKGTMAQDLIKMGREDAVRMEQSGYYSVLYDLIDVNMERAN